MDSTPRTGGSLASAETTNIFGISYDSTVTQPHTSEARMPIEEGRWPSQVRPFTHNRRHTLYKLH